MDHRLSIHIPKPSKQEKEWCIWGALNSNYMEVKHWRSFPLLLFCVFFASLNDVLPSAFLAGSCVFLLLPVTTMARPMKATWIPLSVVYSCIPGTWSTWWRKGQSYTKQSETEQTGLISCYFQGNWPEGFSLAFYLHISCDSWWVGLGLILIFHFLALWSDPAGEERRRSCPWGLHPMVEFHAKMVLGPANFLHLSSSTGSHFPSQTSFSLPSGEHIDLQWSHIIELCSAPASH